MGMTGYREYINTIEYLLIIFNKTKYLNHINNFMDYTSYI